MGRQQYLLLGREHERGRPGRIRFYSATAFLSRPCGVPQSYGFLSFPGEKMPEMFAYSMACTLDVAGLRPTLFEGRVALGRCGRMSPQACTAPSTTPSILHSALTPSHLYGHTPRALGIRITRACEAPQPRTYHSPPRPDTNQAAAPTNPNQAAAQILIRQWRQAPGSLASTRLRPHAHGGSAACRTAKHTKCMYGLCAVRTRGGPARCCTHTWWPRKVLHTHTRSVHWVCALRAPSLAPHPNLSSSNICTHAVPPLACARMRCRIGRRTALARHALPP